jgi:hypothetical protein
VLVLEGELVLDLLELGLNPGVILVAMSVQLGQIAKAFLDATMVDQPTWRFGEQQNKSSKEDSGDDLNSQTGAPLAIVVIGKADVCTLRTLASHV